MKVLHAEPGESDPTKVIDPTSVVEAMLASGATSVSFDVFDTLLWRTTLFPQDAFWQLSAFSPGAGRHARIGAERLAGFLCRSVFATEPTLANIYHLLPWPQQRELEIEQRIGIANPFCLRLVRDLLHRGIKLFALSDMYLESAQIAALLIQCGYPSLPVFSSATENRTKSDDGELFGRVWDRYGIAPASTIHVGDNPHSDIAMARQFGARACQVSTPRDSLLDLMSAAQIVVGDFESSQGFGRLAIDWHCRCASLDASERMAACAALREALPGSSHGRRSEAARETVSTHKQVRRALEPWMPSPTRATES